MLRTLGIRYLFPIQGHDLLPGTGTYCGPKLAFLSLSIRGPQFFRYSNIHIYLLLSNLICPSVLLVTEHNLSHPFT